MPSSDAGAGPVHAAIPEKPGSRAEAGAHNRDKLMMLAATAARMAVGLLTFVLLARYLGPEHFGVIASAMAYAAFIGIVTDYGLGTSALRKASIEPEATREIVGDALAVKALLMLVALVAATIVIALTIPVDKLLVCGLVFFGTAAYSIAELLMVASRANRRFDIEARLVVSTSIVMLALVGGVAAATGEGVFAAAAFAVTRVGYLVAVIIGLRRWLEPLGRMGRSFARMRATLKESAGYAIDNLLTSLSSQIDILLFAFFLSAHQMGIYQSGARLVQVIVPFAVVLSTVYMPTLTASAVRENGGFAAISRRVTLEFALLSIVGGLGFAFVGPFATSWLYGPRYAELEPLWTGFGLFAMLRFAAASFGIQLVALGHIRTRIISQLCSIGLFVGVTLLVLPGAKLAASAWLLALSSLPAFIILGGALALSGRADRSVPMAMAVMLAIVVALVLWIWSGGHV